MLSESLRYACVKVMKTIILASASPRRKELLEQIGLRFKVDPVRHEEKLELTLPADTVARKISLEKAAPVAARHKNAIVIAADTFGVLDGKLLVKPHSEQEARDMLASLSGRSHSVITGFTLMDTDTKKTVSRSVETIVTLKELTPVEIETYVKSGEPLDKAGSYAIQGLGAVLIEKIEGDYYNVVGLPLSALAEALKEFGVSVL